MKRILLTLLLAATVAGTHAQNGTQDITSLMGSTATTRLLQKDVWSLDTLQMDSLYDYWNAYVEAHPKDEQAWRNLFEVNRERSGHFQLHTGDSRAYTQRTNVVGRMEVAIPDTYTFYYCAYEGYYPQHVEAPYDSAAYARVHNQYAERALELLPADASAWDYEGWIANLLTQKTGEDTTALTKVLTRYYESGQYPAEALQYHFNELQGMEEGSIYLGATESDVIGKLILQYVLGVHRDKILYCDRLAGTLYQKAFFQRVGLSLDFFDSEGEWFHLLDKPAERERCLIRHIYEHSEQVVYFSARSLREFFAYGILAEDTKACLYNEGLTMRYSAKPYDNLAVKRRNLEERYRLEYLRLAFQPSKEGKDTQRFQEWPVFLTFDYLLLFYDLGRYYKAHDPKRYAWFNNLFTDIIVQLTRQGHLGVGAFSSVYVIRESTVGGKHYELVEDPTLFDESSRKHYNIPADAAPRVLFKTEPVEVK